MYFSLFIYKGRQLLWHFCYGTKIHPSFWSLGRASNSFEISHSSIYIKMKQVLKHNDCEIIWNSGVVLPPASISYRCSLSHTQVNYSNIKHMCCCRYALHICRGPSIDILNTENNNNDTLSTLTSCFLMMITSLNWTELRGLSPRADYTDRAAAAGRRS